MVRKPARRELRLLLVLVEILYFDGCPNHQDARALVERVSREPDLEPEIRMIEVSDLEAAERLRFLGSPTIRARGLPVWEPERQGDAGDLAGLSGDLVAVDREQEHDR